MEAESVIHPLIHAGVKPALIWAACKTGRLVTDENRNALTDGDIKEWEDALADYKKNYPENDWDMKNLDEVIDRDKF